MTRPLYSIVTGLALLAGMAMAPACTGVDEGDDLEGVDIGSEDLAVGCGPWQVTDPAAYHAKYVLAFNSDVPGNLGCLYEGSASFLDPLTGNLVTGRQNIENAIAPLMQGTTMTAYTRFGYQDGSNLWLGSASWVITDDASGGTVAAGQSADSLRKQSGGNWMQAIDLPFGGQ